MANLPRYTVSKDERKDDWVLRNDQTGRVEKRTDTKAEMTKGGVIERVVGSNGGSVRIQKEDGKYQEERTYPSSRDPRRTKG